MSHGPSSQSVPRFRRDRLTGWTANDEVERLPSIATMDLDVDISDQGAARGAAIESGRGDAHVVDEFADDGSTELRFAWVVEPFVRMGFSKASPFGKQRAIKGCDLGRRFRQRRVSTPCRAQEHPSDEERNIRRELAFVVIGDGAQCSCMLGTRGKQRKNVSSILGAAAECSLARRD